MVGKKFAVRKAHFEGNLLKVIFYLKTTQEVKFT